MLARTSTYVLLFTIPFDLYFLSLYRIVLLFFFYILYTCKETMGIGTIISILMKYSCVLFITTLPMCIVLYVYLVW